HAGDTAGFSCRTAKFSAAPCRRSQQRNGAGTPSHGRGAAGFSSLAALNPPNENDRKTRARNTGPAQSLRGNRMGRTLAAFVVAASLLPLASSDAAAWVCRAVGLGSSGYAGAYDIVDAKLFALRQCERRSPLPVCTLVWCRPGGSRIMSTAPVTDMPRR